MAISVDDFFEKYQRPDNVEDAPISVDDFFEKYKRPGTLKHTAANPEYREAYQSAADQYNIPSAFMADWAQHESSQDAKAEGPDTGEGRGTAKGGFQFLDATAVEQGILDQYDMGQSATGAAKYLRQHLDTFDGDVEKSFAAYHSGAGTVRKAVSEGGDDWLSNLGPEGQKYVRALAPLYRDAQGPGEEDSWWDEFKTVIENFPDRMKQSAAGLAQMAAETPRVAEYEGFTRPVHPRWTVEQQNWKAAVAEAREKGEIPGQKMYAEATADLKANQPNHGDNVYKMFAYDATMALAEMIPILGVSFATGSPAAGVTLMSAYVGGHKYGESREAGRTIEEATGDAAFHAMAEGLTEAIPLGILMTPGKKFLPRLFKAAGAEAIQEGITEILQSSYDIGVIDENMTLKEAYASIDYWKQVGYASLLGATVGGGLAVISHPLVRERKESPGTDDNPTTTRTGAVDFAKQRQEDLEGAPSLTTEMQRELDMVRSIQGDATAIANAYALTLAPEGMVERAASVEVELTQEDLDSPIENDDIIRGKQLIQAALGGTEANKILAELGFPDVGTSVNIEMDEGPRAATVMDVWDENGIRGANFGFEDGTVLSEPFDFLEGRVTERAGEAETQETAPQEAEAEVLAEQEPGFTDEQAEAADQGYEITFRSDGTMSVWSDGAKIGEAKTQAEADAIIDKDKAGEAPEEGPHNVLLQRARDGDTEAQAELTKYGLEWDGNKTKYRIVGQGEVDALLAGETVTSTRESHKGSGRTDITDNPELDAGVDAEGGIRITFQQTDKFDTDKTESSTTVKNKEAGHLWLDGGYSLEDVQSIHERQSDGTWKEVYSAEAKAEDLIALVKDKGRQLADRRDVELAWENDRVFAVHEQDETPTEVTDREMLDKFTPDQLYAVPSDTPVAPVAEDTKAGEAPTGLDTKRLDQVIDILPTGTTSQVARIREVLGLYDADPTDAAGEIGGILEAVSSDLRQQYGPIADVLDEIIEQWDARDTDDPAGRRGVIDKQVTIIASGMSRIGDMKVGTHAWGKMQSRGIGVDVGEVSGPGVKALGEAIANGSQVFIDSGAFTLFRRNMRKGESNALDFDAILKKYDAVLEAAAEANAAEGSTIPPMLVMPDVIGDQAASLELIEKYKKYISTDAKFNLSRPIVPLQKGSLSLGEAYARVIKTLNTDNFIVGIPANKEAVTPEELSVFLDETGANQIHFLGAASDKTLGPYLDVLSESGMKFDHLSADANILRGSLYGKQDPGKTRGEAITDTLVDRAGQEFEEAAYGPIRVRWGNRVHEVDSFEDASRKWGIFRDATNLGASELPLAEIIDANDNVVATIAYNGKIRPVKKTGENVAPGEKDAAQQIIDSVTNADSDTVDNIAQGTNPAERGREVEAELVKQGFVEIPFGKSTIHVHPDRGLTAFTRSQGKDSSLLVQYGEATTEQINEAEEALSPPKPEQPTEAAVGVELDILDGRYRLTKRIDQDAEDIGGVKVPAIHGWRAVKLDANGKPPTDTHAFSVASQTIPDETIEKVLGKKPDEVPTIGDEKRRVRPRSALWNEAVSKMDTDNVVEVDNAKVGDTVLEQTTRYEELDPVSDYGVVIAIDEPSGFMIVESPQDTYSQRVKQKESKDPNAGVNWIMLRKGHPTKWSLSGGNPAINDASSTTREKVLAEFKRAMADYADGAPQREADRKRKQDAIDGAFKDTTNSILDTAAAIKKIATASPDALLGVIKLKTKAWINAERKRAKKAGEDERVEALTALLEGAALNPRFDDEWFRAIHSEAVRKHGQNEKAAAAKKDRAAPGKKYGSTGESLRRWFDGQKAGTGDIHAEDLPGFFANLQKLAVRSDLFAIADLLGDSPTPGLTRYLERVRGDLPTLRDWLDVSSDPNSYSNLNYLEDTGTRRIKWAAETDRYIDLMAEVTGAVRGSNTITEAAKKLRKVDTAMKVGGKRPPGTSNLAYMAWPLSGEPHQYHPLGRLLADEANETKAGTRKTPIIRRRKEIKDLKREGLDDVRKGKNKAPKDLKREFGFADITIGNYVTSAQEQAHVNKSYEAFADLARLLGWTNKDMSFAGDLHYAIGALGSGKWSAHYQRGQESADGTDLVQVINLTNTKGDGALAHEFGHAIDYNLRSTPTSDTSSPAIAWIVKRLRTAPPADHFDAIERKTKGFLKGHFYYPGMKRQGPIAMAEEYLDREARRARHGLGPGTSYKREANRGDKNSKKPYWGKDAELFARAFEAYIYDKLDERSNEYLVTDFVEDSKIESPSHRFAPYPQGKERERFNKMFDQLIEAMSWKDGRLTVDKKLVDSMLDGGEAVAKKIEEMALNLKAMAAEIKQEAADLAAAAIKNKADAEAAEAQKLRDELAAVDDAKKDPRDMNVEEQLLTMTQDELSAELDDIFDAYDEAHADTHAEEQNEAETTAPVEHDIPTTTQQDPKIAGMRKLSKDVADLYAIWNIDQDFVAHDNMSFFADYADSAYGGTRADGVYETKDAYDAMELGVNMAIRDAWPILSMYKADKIIALLERLTDSLPTQSNRSDKQIQYQQFSTPPAYSFVAAWAAKITYNDRVLEPSAGTGSLLVYAQGEKASTIANELDIGRSQVLAELKPDLLLGEDGRYIGNILKLQQKPTVVLMNPPFSSDAKRGAKNKTMRGAEHVESGLEALQEGGRLVAIVGKGMARDTPTFKDWWAKIDKAYTVRAVIEVDGKVYRKYGTSFDNMVLVIDKTGAATISSDIVGGRVETLTALAEKLQGVRDARKQPTSRQSIGSGEAESTAPEPISGPTVTAPTDDALPDDRGTRTGAGSGGTARGPTDRTGSGRPGQPDAVDEGGREPGRGKSQGPRTGGGRTGGTTDTAPGDSGTESGVLAGDIAKSAAKHGVTFTSETLKGLAAVFGGKGKANTFPPGWDEDSFAAAKPHFEKAYEEALAVGADLKTLINILIDAVGRRAEGVLRYWVMTRSEEMQTSDLRKPPPIEVEDEVNPPVVDDSGPKEAKDLTEEVYDTYVAEQAMAGSQPHPADLAESSAMGDVSLPKVSYVPNLPSELLASGDISDAQSEFAVMAGAAHSQTLPEVDDVVYRKGMLNGDGTGFGKSRELMAVILDNMRQGRKKVLYISKNEGLLTELRKDWTGLGQDPNTIFALSKGVPKATEGILYTTYATLGKSLGVASKAATTEFVAGREVEYIGEDRSGTIGVINTTSDKGKVSVTWRTGSKKPMLVDRSLLKPLGEKPQIENIRQKQILEWLGEDFDGVIVFDEAHMMANSLSVEGGFRGGSGKPAAMAIAGIQLAQALPSARVIYATATAAQDVRNLGYMDRLGLWGPGTAFADKTAFIAAFDGDVSGMELVAQGMKAMGMYMARTISFKGLGRAELVHKMSEDQVEIYDELSKAWRIILNNIQTFMESTGAADDSQTASAVQGLIWGFQQRFFARIITTMKMPSIIADAEAKIANGEAAIFQLVGTGDAITKRAIARQQQNGTPIEEIDLSQKDDLIEMVMRAFPVQLFEDDGDGGMVPVSDSAGKPILDPNAVAARDQLVTNLKDIRIPDGPLDILINHFGPDAISEVTGRDKRVVRHKDGTVTYDKVPNQQAEIDAFMDGKKMMLVFSDAGGTGRGYHADLNRKNQALRNHYVVEAGWSATKVVQALGRDHRSNQKQPPVLILTRTEITAEKRFTSSISRRLDSLGALTKGSRKTGGQGMYGPEDNLENEYAQGALDDTFKAIAKNEVEGIVPEDLLNELGISIIGEDGSINESVDLPVSKFLNRLLSVPLTKMDLYYNAFFARLEVAIETAKAAGTFDMGVENLVAEKVTVAHRETVYTDDRTGVETEYVKLEMTDPFRFRSLDDVMQMENEFRQLLFFGTNKKSGKTYAYFTAPNLTKTGNQVIARYRRVGINASIFGSSLVEKNQHRTEGYGANVTKVEAKDIRTVWEQEISEAPQTRTWNEHMIVGAVLPIWDRLQGRTKIYRTIADGERFLGRVIHKLELEDTLEKLGSAGAKVDLSAKDIVKRVRAGYKYSLSNSWMLARKKVGGEWRVRIHGPGFGASGRMAEQLGAIKEVISNKSFYFANAAVIDKITSSNIDVVAEQSPGDDQYSLVGPPNVSDISQLTNRPPPNVQDASIRRDQMKLDELGASIVQIDKWLKEAGSMFKEASGYFKGASSPRLDGTIEFRDKNMNDKIRQIAFQTKQNPDAYMEQVVALDEAMSEAMLRRGFLKQHEIDLAEEIDGRIKRKEAGSEVYSLGTRFGEQRAEVEVQNEVRADLHARLKDIGLSEDVVLRSVAVILAVDKGGNAVEARGKHVPGLAKQLIEIAYLGYSATSQMDTLNHEVIHAMREMGLFKDAEWRTLERAAKADVPLMTMIEAKYARQGLSEEKILEEAIADMHQRWVRGDLRAKGFIRKAFERIRAFFEAIANAFRNNGFNSVDSVFGAIDRGEVGQRGQAEPVSGLQPEPAFETDIEDDPYDGTGGQWDLKDRRPRFDRSGEPFTFDNEETESRWIEARKGAGGVQTWTQRMKARAEHIKNGFSRHFIDLPNEAKFSKAREALRKIEAAPQASKEEVVRALMAITKGMNSADMDLFTRKLVLEDLTYEVNQEHALAFGFTPATVKSELAKVNNALAGRPDLYEKLALRKKIADKVAQAMVDAGVLDAEQIQNPGYYRHQVLEYAQAQVLYAKQGGKKLKTPHWARRMGSTKDINANFLEAEFEWMQKALTDIAVAKTIKWLKGSEYNVRAEVIANAKANNERLTSAMLEKDIEENGYQMTNGDMTSPLDSEWRGFKQSIAIGLGYIRKQLDDGNLNPPPQHRAAARSLTGVDGGETSLFPFLAWIMDNNLPGAMGAGMTFKAINQRKAWMRTNLGERYADPMNIESLIKKGFAPAGHVAWQPDEGKLMFTVKTIPEHVVERMLDAVVESDDGVMSASEVRGAMESVRSMKAVGGPKYQMILPEEVAKSLNDINDNHKEGMFDAIAAVPLSWWKRWVLINPRRFLKYNLNNLSGDLDAVIAGNPRALKHMPQAIKELRHVMLKGEAPSDRYKEAVERGVFDSGLTIQEIPDINYLSQFDDVINKASLRRPGKLVMKPLMKTWRALQRYTWFRENWLRYAAYLDYVERLEAGEGMDTIGYGAGVPEMVDAITDHKDRAALLARELVGDYGAVSDFGRGIRRKVIPFYSWMEINTKRYWRLNKNAWTQGIGQGFKTSGIMGATLGARTTAYLYIRMVMVYGLVTLYNNMMWGDEEDELGAEARARLHIIIGRNKDGSVNTLRVQGALSDYLDWFGLDDVAGMISEIERGRATIGDALLAMAKAPINKVASGITPLLKLPLETATGQSFWPDVFRPGKVRDGWRHTARMFSMEHEYDLIFDRPSRGYGESWVQALIYRRDPGETAYGRIKGMSYDWLRREKGSGGTGYQSARSNALYRWRLAKRFGDASAERKAFREMRRLGINNQALRSSIRNAHPLGGLSKRDRGRFMRTLSIRERQVLKEAIKWYDDTYID